MNFEEHSKMKHKDIDGGYAWVTLAGCFLLYMLAMGTLKVFGILYKELLDIYQCSAGTTALIGSVGSFATCILAPLANTLCTKYSFRKVTFVGGLLIGTSYFLSSFVNRLEYMFLTYSLLAGSGFGLIFTPISTLINFYFDKRRALANGILVSASGVGMFIFSYLYRHLFDTYGFQGGVLVLSGILFNCCVASLSFKQPYQLRKPEITKSEGIAPDTRMTDSDNKNDSEDKESSLFLPENENQRSGKRRIFANELKRIFIPRFSLFRSVSFCLYDVAFAITLLGYGSNFYMIPPHVASLGYGKFSSVEAMFVLGISEVIARIFMGWFVDLKIISAKLIFSISMFVSGISAILVTFTANFTFICIYASIVGIFPGTFYTLMPVILVEVFGLQNLPATYGLVTMSMSFVFLIGQPVLGLLEDITGNWNASFCTSGSVLILAGSLVMLEGVVSRARNTDDKGKTENAKGNKDTLQNENI